MLFLLPPPLRIVLGIIAIGLGVFLMFGKDRTLGVLLALLGAWALYRGISAINKQNSKGKKSYDE